MLGLVREGVAPIDDSTIVPDARVPAMRFERLETSIDGVGLIQAKVLGDERGFFTETYRRSDLAALGIAEEMVQDSHSRSKRGIVRGMHFQVGDGAAKLVRCGRGHIIDVVVDLRRGSPTFGQWEAFDLTEENGRLVYCPIGFAHGFCVVSDLADVFYKQSNYYSDELERGIRYDDPEVAIEWPLPVRDLIPSDRDRTAPTLAEVRDELPFEFRGGVADPVRGAHETQPSVEGELKPGSC
jgi:dTDP-4-dehydrorhamnose 3,5-epimerase